jgi:integrase
VECPTTAGVLGDGPIAPTLPAFWLAANTGMRRSELLGLRWGDVDLESSRLGVNRALVSVAYELHDSPGKTRSSRRSVDLDARTSRCSGPGATSAGWRPDAP